MKIAIETTVKALPEQVWRAWVTPSEIMGWNFASDDWCCPAAEIDLVEGGRFKYRMEAKDGSAGFDFEGTYTLIAPLQEIHFRLDDERAVSVVFEPGGNGIRVVETFDAEDENSAEMQRQGWQAILNNFKAHVEAAAK